VLLVISNVPTHVWSLEVAHQVVGSSYLIFDVSPISREGTDMSKFIVAAWSLHLDLIPSEVGCIVPEPEEPSIVGQRPLFLRAEEIIHSKQNSLQFRAFMKIVENHDFSPHADSYDDSSSSDDDSMGDSLPGPLAPTPLRPRSKVYSLGSDSSSSGAPWSSLPKHGGGVRWSTDSCRGDDELALGAEVRQR
jgi:hypothetical protein